MPPLSPKSEDVEHSHFPVQPDWPKACLWLLQKNEEAGGRCRQEDVHGQTCLSLQEPPGV